eukprot:CAMPEP_0183704666 /NCGR_PEP_ID=MMETSP0737-20130205/1952_1 /TAXON_ID=385413 /ORGANISM="Thalassiosira miniscula, Strain CCMP1093" /LENGTH=1045 /DNA_ID=CAMNT_0025931619 /DNA_START=67 /DNA_END=3204 /DNA_ORIENTATION=+
MNTASPNPTANDHEDAAPPPNEDGTTANVPPSEIANNNSNNNNDHGRNATIMDVEEDTPEGPITNNNATVGASSPWDHREYLHIHNPPRPETIEEVGLDPEEPPMITNGTTVGDASSSPWDHRDDIHIHDPPRPERRNRVLEECCISLLDATNEDEDRWVDARPLDAVAPSSSVMDLALDRGIAEEEYDDKKGMDGADKGDANEDGGEEVGQTLRTIENHPEVVDEDGEDGPPIPISQLDANLEDVERSLHALPPADCGMEIPRPTVMELQQQLDDDEDADDIMDGGIRGKKKKQSGEGAQNDVEADNLGEGSASTAAEEDGEDEECNAVAAAGDADAALPLQASSSLGDNLPGSNNVVNAVTMEEQLESGTWINEPRTSQQTDNGASPPIPNNYSHPNNNDSPSPTNNHNDEDNHQEDDEGSREQLPVLDAILVEDENVLPVTITYLRQPTRPVAHAVEVPANNNSNNNIRGAPNNAQGASSSSSSSKPTPWWKRPRLNRSHAILGFALALTIAVGIGIVVGALLRGDDGKSSTSDNDEGRLEDGAASGSPSSRPTEEEQSMVGFGTEEDASNAIAIGGGNGEGSSSSLFTTITTPTSRSPSSSSLPSAYPTVTPPSWEPLGKVLRGHFRGDLFGNSLALRADGTRLVVGAPLVPAVNTALDGDNDSAGQFRVFDWSGDTIHSFVGDPKNDTNVQSGNNNNNITSNWIQIGNAIDGESGDWAGYSVDISSNGDIVAVGSTFYGGCHGYAVGRVRVYSYNYGTTNETNVWNRMGSDINGESENDSSGHDVALSEDGRIVAIGTPYNRGGGFDAGHVRVYRWNEEDAEWNQMGRDVDGNAGTLAGYSIALAADGFTLAVGSPYDGNGSVRVYRWSDASDDWTPLGQRIVGGSESSNAGHAVALSSAGTTVAIGAIYSKGTAGHVRVYRYAGDDDGKWYQAGGDIDGEAPKDQSGQSVDLSSDGNTLAVGASYNDGNGDNSGHVRVYRFDDAVSDWTQVGRDMDGEGAGKMMGQSVSLSADGTVVAVGSTGDTSGKGGQVHVFHITD